MANTYSLDLESTSSQYASITDAAQSGLDIVGDLTIEAWIKLESLPSSGAGFVIVSKFETNKYAYAFRLDNDSGTYKLRFFYAADGTTVVWNEYAWTPTTAVWYHVAVSFDASEHSNAFYVDGSSIGTANSATSTSIANTAAPFQIGAETGVSGSEYYFDGKIDEVRVWNDIRSAIELLANYKKEIPASESGLVGYWKLNGDYLDETSNNNDLTSSGSPAFSTDVPFGISDSSYSYFM